jgi:hypothetical protein
MERAIPESSRVGVCQEDLTMSDAQAAAVVDLAKEFMELTHRVEPAWKKAYFRFSADESRRGSNASCVTDERVLLVDPFKYDAFFKSMNEKSVRLLKLMEKEWAVVLLSIDSAFDYEIKFEYQNLDRWRITKINGGTGVPEGV